MIVTVPLWLAFVQSLGVECLPVQGDRILVSDLVQVVPGFAGIPSDDSLGYAPVPGTRRMLSGASLQAFAKNKGVTIDGAPDICIVRQMTAIKPEEILEAMRNSWSGADVHIELISWIPSEAPVGKLVFPRSGLLSASSPGKQSIESGWRGYVLYGNNQRFAVSARARVLTNTTRVIASKDIAPGTIIAEDQLRTENCEGCAIDDRAAHNVEEVIGLTSRISIHAGSAILKNEVNRPPDVSKGDLVKVEVPGVAHLIFEGRAESSGIVGSTVAVRNLTSGKDFRAQVTGPKKVCVQ
jgi:flagella basal body P-ring formation protein FlgA